MLASAAEAELGLTAETELSLTAETELGRYAYLTHRQSSRTVGFLPYMRMPTR